jgi:hypothetical protein
MAVVMKKQEYIINTDKKVYIYDDLFNFNTQEKIAHFVWSSFYKPIALDRGYDGNTQGDITISSGFSKEDLGRLQFLDYLPDELKLKHKLSLDTYQSSFVNLVTPSDRFHVHTDNSVPNDDFYAEGEKGMFTSALYYVSNDWHIEYGGDTLFLDEQGQDVELYSQYKTGRFIIFDSRIPHLIRPSTVLAPHYRFSVVLKFTEILE